MTGEAAGERFVELVTLVGFVRDAWRGLPQPLLIFH